MEFQPNGKVQCAVVYLLQFCGFNLTQEECLVGACTHDDGLFWMPVDIIDAALMTRKLIKNLASIDIPNNN